MGVRERSLLGRRSRSWQSGASVLILIVSAALLGTALAGRTYSTALLQILLPVIFVALGIAIALIARFLLLARRQQRETASALDDSEHKYKSVFDHTLDGIFIIDDRGICLEANGAACRMLGVSPGTLVGAPIAAFFAAEADFPTAGAGSLARSCEHRETSVVRTDGRAACAEYTTRANFLPGRHVIVARDITRRKEAEMALRDSEDRFQQMASNIQEIFWMLDARDRKVLYVNTAYETITGRSCQSLTDKPRSYEDAIHPEDRIRVIARLEESFQTGHLDEEFRIVRPDATTRWVWVRGFPVRDGEGAVQRLVGTVQDVTARKLSERQIAHNLDLAEAARAEAEAFRRISLALTQNLSLDYVLDTLLQTLLKLIPCESASVLLVESDTHLFLAREVQNCEPGRGVPPIPETFDARDSRFLMNALSTQKSLLISDTVQQAEWGHFRGFGHLASWMCVPLIASEEVLGFLSLGDTRARTFTREHLRIAESLAIPAAVAIQNARLYERAAIYGTEMERQLADLEMTQQALRLSEEGRTLSEERFTKVFRSSPLPFSITTLDEGLFLEVNDAFERRYGYSRDQLIGRTVPELGLWDAPNERLRLVEEVRTHGRVQNMAACLRSISGEVSDAVVSAQAVDLDGRSCLLEVFEDLPSAAKLNLLPRSKSAAH